MSSIRAQLSIQAEPLGPSLGVVQGSDVRLRVAEDLNSWCTFTMTAEDPKAALLVQRRIVRVQYRDGTAADAFDEFRISRISHRRSVEGGRLLVVTARGLELDLADAGHILYSYPGGQREFEIVGELTKSQWWSTYGIPWMTARGYTYLSLGTVDADELIEMAFTGTPMQLAHECANRRTPTKFRYERNGIAGYNLVFRKTFAT